MWFKTKKPKQTKTKPDKKKKEKRLNYFISSLFISNQFLLFVQDIVFKYLLPEAMFKQWGLKSKTTQKLTPKHISQSNTSEKVIILPLPLPPAQRQEIPSQKQAKNCSACET